MTAARKHLAASLEMLHQWKFPSKGSLVQSVCVSQLDIIEAIMNTSGRRMDVEFKRGDAYIEEHKEKADQGDHAAVEEIVAVLGLTRSNWTGNPEFANAELGFEDENLEEVLKAVFMSFVPDTSK